MHRHWSGLLAFVVLQRNCSLHRTGVTPEVFALGEEGHLLVTALLGEGEVPPSPATPGLAW